MKDEHDSQNIIQEVLTSIDYNGEEFIEENQIDPVEIPAEVQPKVLVQVPDSSKFFANPSQVYEIQFIEIPINNTT